MTNLDFAPPPLRGFVFDRAAANAHVMRPAHARDVVSKTGREHERVLFKKLEAPAGAKLSFDTDGFVKALNAALASTTAGYAMEIRQHGKTLATAQSGWAQRAPDGPEAWSNGLRMHIASCSKLMTAIVMTRMLASRNLSPDTKIIDYLPSYWAKGQNIDKITFRHLMTHTSGFQVKTSDSTYPFMKDQVAAGVMTAALGTYTYENMNFGLCRILIPVLNGNIDVGHVFPAATRDTDWDYATIKAYVAYVQQNLFQPSGVNGPTLDHPGPDVLAYAFPVGAGWNSGDLQAFSGGAAWHMSVSEMLNVMGTFRRGGSIMSTAAAQAMLDNGFGIDITQSTPLGTFYHKNGYWGDGAKRVEQSLAYFLPEDMELVVLVNSPVGGSGEYLTGLVSKLYVDHIVPEIGVGGWIARHGLTSAKYQESFDDLVGNHGMQLVDVSGYGTNHDLYAALWVKTASAPAWQARHGLTAAQYQHEFDTLTAGGFHPVLVNGYTIGGQARFAAIFQKGDTPAWVARHGLTSAQYQKAFDENGAKGFVLDWVSGYSENGQDRYAAIWRKTPNAPAWSARHGLTSAQYQKFFDEMAQKHYKPVVVCGYGVGGQDRYAAIFRQIPNAPSWAARHGLTSQQYQEAFDQMSRQGFRLAQVSGYTVSAGDRFAAIWTK